MQSLDRRLSYLEASKSMERRLERMTDAELDERIAVLLAQWQRGTGRSPTAGSIVSSSGSSNPNAEKQHAKP